MCSAGSRRSPPYAVEVQELLDGGRAFAALAYLTATPMLAVASCWAGAALARTVLSLSDDLPVSIVIVDRAERIDGFLPQLDELSVEGLVMVDDVQVLHYAGRTTR